MASINMNGRQSFLLNDIKTTIRNGGTVTHILNVKVYNEQNPKIGNEIRKTIFKVINHIPITKRVYGIDVTVTWRSNATTSSAYYHSDNAFIDRYVKKHTEILLKSLLGNAIISTDGANQRFSNIFSDNITGLTFLVTKPLVKEIVLIEDDLCNDNDKELSIEQEQLYE
eukprot:NODE_30_length_32972_cov_0.541052.p15 type:complete len:169 gc:universal NODE_30_length_32972_cov_0.541052:32221-32727(+)